MPTYTQLLAEAVWRAQFVPPNLDLVLIRPLRAFYGLGPAEIGAPGDNNHLYGRHRSANWDRTSIYCTNRSYGTTDARDKRGGQDWYRAVDIGIKGQTLYDACRRLDAAVRAGQLPGLAEWFGTFDGVHVVGWYEGHPSSSDSSHLYHLHVGLWNQYADDPATLQSIYAIVTGTEEDDTVKVLLIKDTTGREWKVSGDMTTRQPVTHAAAENAIYWGNNMLGYEVVDLRGKTPYDLTDPNLATTFGVDISKSGGGGTVTGPVDLTPAALDAIEARVDKQLDELAD